MTKIGRTQMKCGCLIKDYNLVFLFKPRKAHCRNCIYRIRVDFNYKTNNFKTNAVPIIPCIIFIISARVFMLRDSSIHLY